jgi:hypothetical protein
MTQEDLKQLREFAKKVACVFYQKATGNFTALQNQPSLVPKSILHLPFGSAKKIKSLTSQEFAELLEMVSAKVGPVKLSFQISTDFLFEKRVGDSSAEQLLQVAFEAHECSKNQDLHLHLFQRLMMENGLSIRQIKNWKLPDSNVLDECFDNMIEHLEAFYEEIKKKHEIQNLQSP